MVSISRFFVFRNMTGIFRNMTGIFRNMTGIGKATTQIRAGWRHEFDDTARVSVNRVSASTTPADFRVQSADTGRDWLSRGCQLDWAILFGDQPRKERPAASAGLFKIAGYGD